MPALPVAKVGEVMRAQGRKSTCRDLRRDQGAFKPFKATSARLRPPVSQLTGHGCAVRLTSDGSPIVSCGTRQPVSGLQWNEKSWAV